jgi:hypothetical protein
MFLTLKHKSWQISGLPWLIVALRSQRPVPPCEARHPKRCRAAGKAG